MADASLPVRCGLARASHGLEFHLGVIAEYLALGHDVEVVGVTVLVGLANLGAPLLVSAVGAKVGDHDDDALTCGLAGPAVAARRTARGSQVVALAASSAAPPSSSGIEESLRAGRSVDPGGDSQLRYPLASVVRLSFAKPSSTSCTYLPAVPPRVSTTTTCAFLTIVITLHTAVSSVQLRILVWFGFILWWRPSILLMQR